MPKPGQLFGTRYRLHERIGAGGTGELWRASDEKLERTVALKIMHHALLEDPDFPSWFRADARSLAKIRHPGVVAVYDFDDAAVPPFLVMEHIAGEPLSAVLRRAGRLPVERTTSLVAQAADALQAAHDRGVVHRGVKPANLLLGADTVVLTGFGMAGPLEGTRQAVAGTAAYLAPEQASGEPATTRSDIYALGVVAFECLTGARPSDGPGPAATTMVRVHESPQTLPAFVPPAVVAVLESAMATDPAARWSSAAEFARACENAAAAATRSAAPAAEAGAAATAGSPTWIGPTSIGARQLQPVDGIRPVAIALPGHPAAGYTLRAYLSPGTSMSPGMPAREPDEVPVFLSLRGRLLLFSTADALVSFVHSDNAHDMAQLDGWAALVASLDPYDVAASDAAYDFDLVPVIARDLRRALDTGDVLLLISAAELARELAQALPLEAVRALLAPGSVLDWLDRTLLAGDGAGLSALRRQPQQLRRIGNDASLAWSAVVARIGDVVEWRG